MCAMKEAKSSKKPVFTRIKKHPATAGKNKSYHSITSIII
jgi:hypothetical protein